MKKKAKRWWRVPMEWTLRGDAIVEAKNVLEAFAKATMADCKFLDESSVLIHCRTLPMPAKEIKDA